jgi:hypothetical protein
MNLVGGRENLVLLDSKALPSFRVTPYLYSSAIDYSGKKGLITIDFLK